MITTPSVLIPPDVLKITTDNLGSYSEAISGTDRSIAAADHLDCNKSVKRAEMLQQHTDLKSKKLLEIGSGFGTNLAVWIKDFDVDGYGIEPDSEAFDSSFLGSQKVFAANGLDSERIIKGFGENLPFEDETFDIVYSANVLEHTRDAEAVFMEAFRVLKRGGLLFMEMPNFLSYFEGHYMVIQPPILWRWMLPVWVQFVFRRDPAFARTLNTAINPLWCRRMLRKAAKKYGIHSASLGEEVFLARLAQPFNFETKAVSSRLGPLLHWIQELNYRNWIGHLIVTAQGQYPIYLSAQRD